MRSFKRAHGAMLLIGVFLLAASIHAESRIVSWNRFIQNFLDGYFRFRPDLAVSAGRHEFDGRLPDWSPEGLGLMVHFLKEQRAEAVKFGALNRVQEFERGYLIAHLDSELFWLEVAELPFTNPTYYTSF